MRQKFASPHFSTTERVLAVDKIFDDMYYLEHLDYYEFMNFHKGCVYVW